MKGWLIFCTISALLGIITAIEGIGGIFIFLLFLFGLKKIKKASYKWIFINSIFYLCYFFIGNFTAIENKTSINQEKDQFLIQFSDEVIIDGNRFRAVVSDTISKEKLILTYSIPTEMEKKRLQRNVFLKNICRVKGKLITPKKARNENAFNYQNYLKQKHIFWELQISDLNIENCKIGKITLIDSLKLLRLKGISLVEKNFTEETAPMAAALIFGTRDLLSADIINSYQKLGVIHLISISGLHVALLVGLIFYLGIRIGFVREKLTYVLIGLLPLYAVLTGATPSVNRAVMMAMLILLVRQINLSLKIRSLDGLCVSFLLLTIYNPLIINNIGFQLSYIVTFSLLLSYPIIERFRTNIGKMILTSYISQASALPFLLFHFYEIPLISIAANLLFIPLYSFLFLPGFILMFILQFISIDLFMVLSYILSFMMNLSNQLAEWISLFKWTSLITGRPPEIFLFFYAIAILFAFFYWEKKSNFKLIFFLPWVVLAVQLFFPNFSPEGEVSVIDVGQGDSIFIHLPHNNGNYLIDTGGSIIFHDDKWKQKKQSFEVGQDVLIPFLKSKGITKLDLLILSHGDFDHIGGSLSLLKEIEVKRILFPSVQTEKSAYEKEVFELAGKQNIKVSYVSEGASWKIKDDEFFILSPPKNFSGEKNDGSLVLFAKIGGINWLFTGDLGKEGELEILKKYPNISIDVLKVGHHGSKTSTSEEFIEHSKPKYSIISVGKKNRFGHPHSEVLKILEDVGSEILRTDIHGEISYKFKGERGTFFKGIP